MKKGGMGSIYFLDRISPRQGIDRVHLQKLAAKGVNQETLQESDLNLFEKELNIWIVLEHPHILKMLKICHVRGVLLALMPVCKCSLRDIIQQRKKFSEEEVMTVADQVSAALAYAYDNFGIVHLDIKPENVMQPLFFDEELRVELSDWGISTIQRSYAEFIASNHSGTPYTQTFNNYGTLPYMSPERLIRGFPSTPLSDIYSLGMMMLEMLCGALPFNFNSGKDLSSQILDFDFYQIAKDQLEHQAGDSVKRLIMRSIHQIGRAHV